MCIERRQFIIGGSAALAGARTLQSADLGAQTARPSAFHCQIFEHEELGMMTTYLATSATRGGSHDESG